MSDHPVVLVTAIGSYGEQILKALRHSDAAPCTIVGADTDPFSPHFAMVDAAVVLPPARDPDYVEAVFSVCRKYKIAAIFPGCEPELLIFSHARDRFERDGVMLMINPAHVIDLCSDKLETGRRLRDLGFEPPRFASVRTEADLDDADWFPVVVKPQTGGGGSKGCYIAQSRRELLLLRDYIGAENGLFIQEYVGTPDQEFTVGVLVDLDGELINSIALRRSLVSQLSVSSSTTNRSGRHDLGDRLVISSGVSQGEIGHFPNVTDACETIALAIGARTPINIQCRLVEGQVKVFEINPRFSGTTFIRAMMGYNEPDVLVRRHLLNQTIEPRFAYRRGTVRRSLQEQIVGQQVACDWRQIVRD